MQVVLVYIQPFRLNSLLKYVSQPEIARNSLTTYFGGSRSFKVIDVNILKKLVATVLVMISSMPVPICNHFHVRRASSGRITPFKGCLYFSPSFVLPLNPMA